MKKFQNGLKKLLLPFLFFSLPKLAFGNNGLRGLGEVVHTILVILAVAVTVPAIIGLFIAIYNLKAKKQGLKIASIILLIPFSISIVIVLNHLYQQKKMDKILSRYENQEDSYYEEQGEYEANGDYCLDLNSHKAFLKFQKAPLTSKFNNVLSLKMVFAIESHELYYLNSNEYKHHYEFCQTVLNDTTSLTVFNTLNYGTLPQRKYALANLNYYSKNNLYTLEFASSDKINASLIKTLYGEILKHSYLDESLRVLIDSDYLVKMDSLGQLSIPKIHVSELYELNVY